MGGGAGVAGLGGRAAVVDREGAGRGRGLGGRQGRRVPSSDEPLRMVAILLLQHRFPCPFCRADALLFQKDNP